MSKFVKVMPRILWSQFSGHISGIQTAFVTVTNIILQYSVFRIDSLSAASLEQHIVIHRKRSNDAKVCNQLLHLR